jgi:hypothetical protein
MVDPPQYPGAPRWVKIAGAIAVAVVVALAVMALIKGGHGPHQHFGDHGSAP